MVMKFLLIFLALFVVWIAFVEPYILTTNYGQIKDKNLAGLRVVFVSDLHYKPYEKFRLIRDVKKIQAQNPDIVLFGGDFVNGHKKHSSLNPAVIAEELGKIKSKYGSFAVLGNHDVWHDAYGISKLLKKNNITVLKNSNKKVGDFTIAGVEDMQTQSPNVEKALNNVETPVILLSHTPDIFDQVPDTVNLTLAGHVHGGQVKLPFKGAVFAPSKFGTKYAEGYFNDMGRKMIVTKGMGTSILPIRFLCFPEIVLIEFVD